MNPDDGIMMPSDAIKGLRGSIQEEFEKRGIDGKDLKIEAVEETQCLEDLEDDVVEDVLKDVCTLCEMEDPVILPDGFSYEKLSVEQLKRSNGKIHGVNCPD